MKSAEKSEDVDFATLFSVADHLAPKRKRQRKTDAICQPSVASFRQLQLLEKDALRDCESLAVGEDLEEAEDGSSAEFSELLWESGIQSAAVRELHCVCASLL